MATQPSRRPARPQFSSGPCAKRPGWALENLRGALLGRSHRAAPSRARLREVIDRSRALLRIPDGHRLGIVAGSNTGAFEMALWSLLGPRGVDVLAWESFGQDWVKDIQGQLRLDDVRVLRADYGALPDLGQVQPDRDVVFPWNGTTSGVRVPHGDWIAADREGLTLCDATSAIFAMDLPWDKLDVATWSWQKVLGGEAGHGMLALSPRAVERLESWTPPRPLPKLFRLTQGGKLMEGVFRGDTINTPSMLCVEDWLDALDWAESVGGLDALVARADENAQILAEWVGNTQWVDYLAKVPRTRSNTSVCLKITDPSVTSLSRDAQRAFVGKLTGLLDAEAVAYDIAAHRDAPPGLRIWAGATIEKSDMQALTPWLDWAFESAKSAAAQAA